MPMNGRLLRPRARGFNPKSISGLVAWFDADDASTFTLSGTDVAEWRDKSGNGYLVSQSTANNRPARTASVLGRAAVDFDGANDCLFADNTGISSAFSGSKSITAFAVGQMHTTAEAAINNVGAWVALGSTTSFTPLLYIRGVADSGNFQLAIRNDASSTTGGIFAFSNLINDGTPSSFVVSVTSPVDGTAVQRAHAVVRASTTSATNTASSARPPGAITLNRFTIGAFGQSSFADFFPGRISEIILYNRALDTEQRTQLVAWLAKKYNVTTPVV